MSADLNGCVEQAMDLIALNRRQQDALFNADRKVNSAIERVIALRRYGVPEHAIRALLCDLKIVLDLNAQEGGGERALTGILDQLARRPTAVRASIDVKGLRKALKEPLKVLRDSDDAKARLHAEREVRRIAAKATHAQLTGKGLRHELRDSLHDQLLDLLGLRVGEGA